MKKLILVIVIILCAGSAWAYCQIEWKCFNECMSQGYMYGYCKAICTWCN